MPVAAAAAAGRNLTRSRRVSQLQLPGLADQVVTEAMVALLVNQPEPRGLVDAPRRHEHAVGPERHLAVAHLPREAHALGAEARADTETARAGLDEQETQLAHGLGALHEEHRPDDLAVLLGDPAPLPLRVVALD